MNHDNVGKSTDMGLSVFGLTDREKLKDALPRKFHKDVGDEIIKLIDGMSATCGIEQEYMEESILTHLPLLKDMANIDLRYYINAIKYCNLKQNMSNAKAWSIVFPEKVERLKRDGRIDQLDRNVYNYNKRKLISKIDADMAVAVFIQYAPMRHKAIMHQFNLMNGKASVSLVPVWLEDETIDGEGRVIKKLAKDEYGRRIQAVDAYGEKVFEEVHQVVTPKIQQEAGNTLIALTAMPEEKDINIKIGLTDEAVEATQGLNDRLNELANAQLARLNNGASIDDVQRIGHVLNPVIDVDAEEDK